MGWGVQAGHRESIAGRRPGPPGPAPGVRAGRGGHNAHMPQPPTRPPWTPGQPLPVLHQDTDLVAVDKPAGLLVHRTGLDAHEQLNALALLQSQLGQRLWCVHRLDKATSGLLLLARSAEAARALGEAFMAGQVRKRYLALVRGWPPETGTIAHPLARDPEQPSAGQVRLDAVTHYRRLACHDWPFGDGRHPSSRYALVLVAPETGRRHQIRRHFKHIAHPLVGDSTHGKGAHNRAVAQWLGLGRLWLHACALALPATAARPALQLQAAPGPEWSALGAGLAGPPWAAGPAAVSL